MNLQGIEMKNEKSRNSIAMYTISLYILTFCMGIFMMIGYYRGIDLNFLATIQMFYPALIVIILEKTSLPILQHLYIIETIFGIIFGIISLFRMDVIWVFSIISLIIHVIFLVIILKAIIKQKNRKCNFKKNFFLFMIYILFWLIYFGAYAYLEGNFQLFLQKITNLHLWKNFIFYLPIFLVNFLPFIGEEYGWRFFLQPKLQDKYGKFSGTVMVGIIWGLWHIPFSIYYVGSPAYWLESIACQTLNCVILAFIFAIIYDKSKSLILISLIHYVHNLMIGRFEMDEVINRIGYKGTYVVLCILAIICVIAFFNIKINKYKFK